MNPVVEQLIQVGIENNAQIVEVSETPKLEIGRVKQLIGEVEGITCILCENIIENFY